jgi:DNA-binding FadR family transcriptional regulator
VAVAIAERRWKLDERLSAEQALADFYGVSRNVVREAISRPRADGLVQSRQGVGAFVARAQGTGVLRFDAELLSDRTAFGKVFELHAMLEIRGAGLAAERRSAAGVAAIAHVYERMVREPEGKAGGVDADLDFRRALARATGNAQIAALVSFLSDQIREPFWRRGAPGQLRGPDHRGDARRACRDPRYHLVRLSDGSERRDGHAYQECREPAWVHAGYPRIRCELEALLQKSAWRRGSVLCLGQATVLGIPGLLKVLRMAQRIWTSTT